MCQTYKNFQIMKHSCQTKDVTNLKNLIWCKTDFIYIYIYILFVLSSSHTQLLYVVENTKYMMTLISILIQHHCFAVNMNLVSVVALSSEDLGEQSCRTWQGPQLAPNFIRISCVLAAALNNNDTKYIAVNHKQRWKLVWTGLKSSAQHTPSLHPSTPTCICMKLTRTSTPVVRLLLLKIKVKLI